MLTRQKAKTDGRIQLSKWATSTAVSISLMSTLLSASTSVDVYMRKDGTGYANLSRPRINVKNSGTEAVSIRSNCFRDKRVTSLSGT